jgi:probable H4MPT-linked C1 transfer pathway protein
MRAWNFAVCLERSMPAQVLGFDIGGANLKAAHTSGMARQVPFELWKHPEQLIERLQRLLRGWPPYESVAVTMTGELCDCFETRRQGVGAILSAVESAAGGTPVHIWQVSGRFASIDEAKHSPLDAASANWSALATFCGRFVPLGPALVIDVGSTTTDIVPLKGGKLVARGRTDLERLQCRELVYTGVRRTPVCALLGDAAVAELFATTLDAYLLLDEIEEDPTDRFTADGRPALKTATHARLARMLGADPDMCQPDDTLALAAEIKARQIRLLHQAVQDVSDSLENPPEAAILAGSGEFLAEQVLGDMTHLPLRQISLSRKLGPVVSQAACAFAVAILLAEQVSRGA